MDFLLPVELRPERDDAAGVVAARLPWLRALLVLMTMHKLVVSQQSKTFLKLEVYPSSSMLSTPKVLIIGYLDMLTAFSSAFGPRSARGVHCHVVVQAVWRRAALPVTFSRAPSYCRLWVVSGLVCALRGVRLRLCLLQDKRFS